MLGLVGCSSAPESAPPSAEDGASAVAVDPWLVPDAGLVAAFKARFEALAGAPACQAALVRDEPEHAHALFLQSQDDALRQALADAFAQQPTLADHRAALDGHGFRSSPRGSGEVAYLDSERVRRDAPEVHRQGRDALARALVLRRSDPDEALDLVGSAEEVFKTLKDQLLAQEAALVRVSIEEPTGPEEWHDGLNPGASDVQRVQADVFAYSAQIVTRSTADVWNARMKSRWDPLPHERVVEFASALRHATALFRLDELMAPDAPRAAGWVRTLCQIAIERRLPLVALRHAATLVRGRTDVPGADRLLVARAHHLAAQTEPALAQAIQAADDARAAGDRGAQATARALVAELLLDLGRPEAAVEEFAAAEALFLQAGDPEGRLRQAVNRAGVLVRLKKLDEAEAALAPVQGLSLPGEQGADLACRRGVTEALLSLVAGRVGADEAAQRVEEALEIARAAGAYHAVERYADLPKRLRPGPG